MAGERILIVDDKVEITSFLTDLLQPLGYRLSIAMNGRDGLARALEEKPDLILLDLQMPGMSGLEVLEALHQRQSRSPVILMTLYGSESIAVQAFRLGVRNYINKPFNIGELLAAIEGALEAGRLRRERERLVAELSETNTRLTQRMRELSVLQAVGRSVASLMPRDVLLRRILDAAVLLAGTEAAALFLPDRTDGQLRLEAARQGQSYHVGLQMAVHDSHADDVFNSGQANWISTPTKHTGVTAYLGDKAPAVLYVPVKYGYTVLGVIAVAGPAQEQAPSSEIQDRLTSLADYIAISLENARLFGNLERHTQQLTTVNSIARMIASSLDLSEIMRTVVQGVKDNLHVETASLVLVDERQGDLVFEITLGESEQRSSRFRMAAGQGLVGWVVEHGQSVRINDVTADERFFQGVDQLIGFQTHSILCVPLVSSDRVLGAIEAINKLGSEAEGRGQFTAEDEELLHGAAAFVAIAVENAKLHAAMRETIAGKTLQDTMVTLAHYVNNPLQALLVASQVVRADLCSACGASLPPDCVPNQAMNIIRHKVHEIAAVISVMEEITSPESTLYLGSIHMLDIERELRARLASAPE